MPVTWMPTYDKATQVAPLRGVVVRIVLVHTLGRASPSTTVSLVALNRVVRTVCMYIHTYVYVHMYTDYICTIMRTRRNDVLEMPGLY